jgi:hypothetical protein
MSSPKEAVVRPARRGKPVAAAAETSPDALSAEARHLAADIERALAEGRADALSADALQALMAALCRTYAVQVERGAEALPLAGPLSSTDVMLMASGLLRSSNLAVFELGMWQSWTGR